MSTLSGLEQQVIYFLVSFVVFFVILLAIASAVTKRQDNRTMDYLANQQPDYTQHDHMVTNRRVQRTYAADRINGKVNRFVARGGQR